MSVVPQRREHGSQQGPPRFLGKYRGVVERNKDPDKLGRITAIVPPRVARIGFTVRF